MSNEDLLTAAELAAWRPDPATTERIERCRSRFGLARRDFRVVDWGCGRGKHVLWLRERGYDAVGVDIDPKPFANGADLFRAMGHDPEQCLRPLSRAGTAPLPGSSCHFVTSWQTLEHVRDLDAMARECARIMLEGGEGFHVYPPHRRFVEPHLFMPLVHWLPKNATRRWLIAAFVLLGVEPAWWPANSWRKNVAVYYRYSVDHTFYRPPEMVRRSLAAAGFDVEFVDVEAAGAKRRLARRWLGPSMSARLTRAWYLAYGRNLGLATIYHREPVRA